MNNNRLKVLGIHLFGVAFAFALIHFWLAELLSSFVKIDTSNAYLLLVVMLLAWGIWTALQIVKGKDKTGLKLEQWLAAKP